MKIRLLFSILMIALTSLIYAQDDRIILTIDEEDITVDEFMHIYNKNNSQVAEKDQRSIEDYLDLFINFKLKVKEAESLGMDTAVSFVKELEGYRKQLAEPYFANDEIMDELVREAYERSKYDIRASHILVLVGPNAMPDDTLKAYNKIMEARNEILQGRPFEEVAVEYSEDPSVNDRPGRGGMTIKGNKGDLGYFTVLNMVYPFENAAYQLEIDELSEPVRTDFGYHLIKVTDKINSLGDIEVAHLFLQTNDTMTEQQFAEKEELANKLYKRVLDGENYEDLVKEYSDDKGSAANGGKLPRFTSNRMVPEFIEAIAQLADSGDISNPVLTSYGFHIIKLIEKTGIQPFEEVEKDLANRIKKDMRAKKSEESIYADIKKEYNFSANEEALEGFYRHVDSTIYKKKWEVPIGIKLGQTAFTIGDSVYTMLSFARFLSENQHINSNEPINEFINRQMKTYINQCLIDYEDARLEEKYPEFNALMKEYRGGILLFDLTEEKVWSKAVKDTNGLHNYYDKTKNDYKWGDRVEATMYFIVDEAYVDQVYDLVKNGLGKDEVLAAINNDSLFVVNARFGKFSKGDHKLIDQVEWKVGLSDVVDHNMKKAFVNIHKLLKPELKTFEEARGLVIAGYQEYLESEWIKELRKKYPVTIHKKVLKSLSKND